MICKTGHMHQLHRHWLLSLHCTEEPLHGLTLGSKTKRLGRPNENMTKYDEKLDNWTMDICVYIYR